MKKSTFAYSMMAVILGSVVMSTSVLAADTMSSDGAQIDSSISQFGGFMDDSATTAKVKSALIDDKEIKSTDISVRTKDGVVTLSGFVSSQDEDKRAVAAVSNVEGVESVSDKLQIDDTDGQSISDYAGDAAITSSVKAKLLSDDIVPSGDVSVETVNGIVQLTGTVDNESQSLRAESIAKAVDGVKSVKNDLQVNP